MLSGSSGPGAWLDAATPAAMACGTRTLAARANKTDDVRSEERIDPEWRLENHKIHRAGHVTLFTAVDGRLHPKRDTTVSMNLHTRREPLLYAGSVRYYSRALYAGCLVVYAPVTQKSIEMRPPPNHPPAPHQSARQRHTNPRYGMAFKRQHACPSHQNVVLRLSAHPCPHVDLLPTGASSSSIRSPCFRTSLAPRPLRGAVTARRLGGRDLAPTSSTPPPRSSPRRIPSCDPTQFA